MTGSVRPVKAGAAMGWSQGPLPPRRCPPFCGDHVRGWLLRMSRGLERAHGWASRHRCPRVLRRSFRDDREGRNPRPITSCRVEIGTEAAEAGWRRQARLGYTMCPLRWRSRRGRLRVEGNNRFLTQLWSVCGSVAASRRQAKGPWVAAAAGDMLRGSLLMHVTVGDGIHG